MPKEKSAGAVIFRREPARNASPARQPDGSHGGGPSDAGGDSKIYYLLLHYEKANSTGGGGHWDFPKGHAKEGEKEEETVKREVAEETGIKDIKIIKGFREWIKYFFRDSYNSKVEERNPPSLKLRRAKASWVFKIVIFYLVKTKIKEVKISFEHIDYKWLPYKEALEQLTFKKPKEVLKKANDFISKRGL